MRSEGRRNMWASTPNGKSRRGATVKPLMDAETSGLTQSYSVLCTLYSALCTLYSVLCTLYSAPCTLHSAHSSPERRATLGAVVVDRISWTASTHLAIR
jgi:hypothetical protein